MSSTIQEQNEQDVNNNNNDNSGKPQEQQVVKNVFSKQMKYIVKLQKNDFIVHAECLYLNEKYSEAKEYILKHYPPLCLETDQEVLALLGHIEIKRKQYDQAIKYFEQALIIPGNHTVYVKDSLGIAHYMINDYEASCKYFGEASNQDINNITYHLHFAYATQKMIENISFKLTKAKTKDDKAELHEELKMYKEQIKEEYSQILRIEPNHYETLLNYGVFEARDNHLEEAEKLFNSALSIREGDPTLYLNIGNIQLKYQKFKNAIDNYEKAIAIIGKQNTQLKLLIPYMVALYKMDKWVEVEQVARRILMLDKHNLKALAMLTKSLKENKHYEELTKIYNDIQNKVNYIDSKRDQNEKVPEGIKKIQKQLKQKTIELTHLKQFQKESDNNEQQQHNTNNNKKDKQRNSNSKQHNNSNNTGDSNDISINENELTKNDILSTYTPDKVYSIATSNYNKCNYIKAKTLYEKLLKAVPNYEHKQTIYEKLGDIHVKHLHNYKAAVSYYTEAININANEILHNKLGTCYECLNQYEPALNEYKKSYSLNPALILTTYHIGNVLAKMKHPDALEHLRTAYEYEKENVNILQAYSNELVHSTNPEHMQMGIDLLEKARTIYIGNVDILCSLAIGYERTHRLDDAINLLESCLSNALFANDKHKLLQLAYYYEKDNSYGKAVELFKSVLSIDEYDVDSLLHLGIIFNSAKEYKKAYKCFHTVISIEPTNAIANYGLGKIYQLKHENYNEAIKHYNTCIEHDPTNIKAYIQIGIIYLQTNNLSKAKTYLKKAYAIDKSNVECLVAIANVYHQLKEYKTCEKYLQKAYEINDSDINVLCSYGSVLFAMGKYKEAIRKYEKTLGYSKIADVHFNLGHCYFIIEKFDFAISHYISALKIKKNQANDTYYYYLACALIVVKRYNDAITALKCAIKINCKNGGYYYKLANVWLEIEKYSKVIKCVEKAEMLCKEQVNEYTKRDLNFLRYKAYVKLQSVSYDVCEKLILSLLNEDKNNVNYLEQYALLLESAKKYNEAKEVYMKIIGIDSNNQNALNGVERL